MPEQEMQTLGQERAAYAWEKVKRIDQEAESLKKKYHSLVRQLGALIQTNGLGLTLSFLRAKAQGNSEDAAAAGHLYDHVSHWLKEADHVSWAHMNPDLIDRLTASNSWTYLQATQEALDLVIWLRRFAEALLPEEG